MDFDKAIKLIKTFSPKKRVIDLSIYFYPLTTFRPFYFLRIPLANHLNSSYLVITAIVIKQTLSRPPTFEIFVVVFPSNSQIFLSSFCCVVFQLPAWILSNCECGPDLFSEPFRSHDRRRCFFFRMSWTRRRGRCGIGRGQTKVSTNCWALRVYYNNF